MLYIYLHIYYVEMLYQLPNGKVVYLSIEEYLDLTDEDVQYLMSLDYGEHIVNPFSGSAKTGSSFTLISFENVSAIFSSSNQGDLGGIGFEYTNIKTSGSNTAGVSGDIIFKVAGTSATQSAAREVLRLSAVGSDNNPRIGIGNFSGSSVSAPLHVKGNTVIEDGTIY